MNGYIIVFEFLVLLGCCMA